MTKMKEMKLTQTQIDIIKQNTIAPELLPAIIDPKEIQDLRKINEADTKDIQDWIDTAEEVLPEILIDIQLTNDKN